MCGNCSDFSRKDKNLICLDVTYVQILDRNKLSMFSCFICFHVKVFPKSFDAIGNVITIYNRISQQPVISKVSISAMKSGNEKLLFLCGLSEWSFSCFLFKNIIIFMYKQLLQLLCFEHRERAQSNLIKQASYRVVIQASRFSFGKVENLIQRKIICWESFPSL